MGYKRLDEGEEFWRPSNQMGVENTDLAKQLEAKNIAARLWRLKPGQASTKHRHRSQEELYVLIEGTGRIRIDDEVLTLETRASLLIEPDTVRQLFNDTDSDQLWLVAGAPRESVTSTLEMNEDDLAFMYPDGPKALPPELGHSNLDIIDRALEAMASGDLDTLIGLADPECEVDTSRYVFNPGVYRGHEGLRAAIATRDETWAEIRMQRAEVIESGDRVLVLGKLVGIGKESGLEVEQFNAQLWTVRNGKIQRLAVGFADEEAARAALLEVG